MTARHTQKKEDGAKGETRSAQKRRRRPDEGRARGGGLTTGRRLMAGQRRGRARRHAKARRGKVWERRGEAARVGSSAKGKRRGWSSRSDGSGTRGWQTHRKGRRYAVGRSGGLSLGGLTRRPRGSVRPAPRILGTQEALPTTDRASALQKLGQQEEERRTSVRSAWRGKERARLVVRRRKGWRARVGKGRALVA